MEGWKNLACDVDEKKWKLALLFCYDIKEVCKKMSQCYMFCVSGSEQLSKRLWKVYFQLFVKESAKVQRKSW